MKPIAVTAAERTKGCCQPVAPPLPDAEVTALAEIFKALADPTRLQILHILADATEPICVCDFTAGFDLGQPTVSHHLAKLREAGLVVSSKGGIWAFYSLDPKLSPAARKAVDIVTGTASRQRR